MSSTRDNFGGKGQDHGDKPDKAPQPPRHPVTQGERRDIIAAYFIFISEASVTIANIWVLTLAPTTPQERSPWGSPSLVSVPKAVIRKIGRLCEQWPWIEFSIGGISSAHSLRWWPTRAPSCPRSTTTGLINDNSQINRPWYRIVIWRPVTCVTLAARLDHPRNVSSSIRNWLWLNPLHNSEKPIKSHVSPIPKVNWI